MAPTDYNKMYAEWTTVGDYRADLGTNPTSKLVTWAYNNGFEYSRLIPKNTEVRKIGTVAAQVKYCHDKAAEAKAKINGTVVAEPVIVKPAKVKHDATCRCTACKAAKTNVIVEPVTLPTQAPIATLSAMLPNDFNGVITSIINIQSKMAADLRKKQEIIDKLQADNTNLKLGIEQFKMLTAPKVKTEVCDICYIDSENYVKCDYDIYGYDNCCTSCWDKQVKNTILDEPQSVVSSAVSDTSEEDNCICGKNEPFESDVVTPHCCDECGNTLCEKCISKQAIEDIGCSFCDECYKTKLDNEEEIPEDKSTVAESTVPESTDSESTEEESIEEE